MPEERIAKPVLAAVFAVLLAESASADMAAPLHTRVPARTTVTLEKPIPGYVFYAASQFEDGYIVRLPLDKNSSAEAPYLNDRMVLIAVPVAVAERFPAVEELVKELRKGKPEGVRWYDYDGFFFEFTLDTYRDDKLHIVIRQGKDGIEFEKTHEPKATGSRWLLIRIGLLSSALAIYFGVRFRPVM